MLKLVKWEWETKVKKALMLWAPVLIVLAIISWIVQGHLLHDIVLLTIWACVFILGRIVVAITWKEQEMKGAYLLFTIPETVPKVLAAKLLASLPLLLIISIATAFFIFPLFAWWQFLITFCTLIMLRFFGLALEKTIPAGKWYKDGLVVLLYWSAIAAAWLFVSDIEVLGLTDYPILFLIGVSTVLFFASAYLLENKLDVW